jgi:hypothetical protein
VEYASHAFNRSSANVKVREVAFDPFITASDVPKIGTVPGGEIVDHPDFKAFLQQRFDQVRTDEACSTCNQNAIG